MVSKANSQVSVVDASATAYETLAAIFGEPALVSSGFRWQVVKPSGNQAVVELTFPGGGGSVAGHKAPSSVVWIFDPDAEGISTFNSVDVNSVDGLDWLRMEVKRLARR